MKRLVNIYKFLPLIAMAAVAGCSTDSSDLGIEIIPTQEEIITEGFSVATTIGSEVVDSSDAINVGSYITFTDTSVDAESRTWSIEDGAWFLEQGFDSTISLASQIDTEKGSTSDELQESVYFAVPGYSTVTMLSKFTQNVGYENDDVTAIYYNGNWEVTTKFNVPVFAAELSPVLRVSSGDNSVEFSTAELNNSTAKTLEVGRGDDVLFEDLTEELGFTAEELVALESSLSRTWSYSDGENEQTFDDTEATTATIAFETETGTQHLGFGINISRALPIAATTGDMDIPLIISIVDAQIKVLSLEITSSYYSGAHNAIVITLDKSMSSTISSYAGFTVAVTNNDVEVSGITITSAYLDADDDTKIILTLSETLYSDDVITLAYNGEDNIRSATDYASIDAFTATEVTNNIGSVLNPDMFGCEDYDLGTKLSTSGVTWYAASTFNNYITYAEDPTNSENQVLMVTIPETNTTNFTINNTLSTAPIVSAGSYMMKYKLYIDETTGGEMSDCLHQIQCKSTAVAYTTAYEDTYPTERDEWVTISEGVTFDVEMESFQVKFAFSKTTYTDYPENAIFYFDDFELVPIRLTVD